MKLTYRRLAVAHFVLAAVLFGACLTFACEPYPEPTLQPETCRAPGQVRLAVDPDGGACVFGRLYTAGFLRVFYGFPGVRTDAVAGTTVYEDPSIVQDAGAFGLTHCDSHVVLLASVPTALVHELVHVAEGCPYASLPDGGIDQHIGWDERGVYAAIYDAENLF